MIGVGCEGKPECKDGGARAKGDEGHAVELAKVVGEIGGDDSAKDCGGT